MASLGQLIADLRERHSLTQQELADAAGLSVETVRRVEHGREISPRSSIALYHALRPMTRDDEAAWRQFSGLTDLALGRAAPPSLAQHDPPRPDNTLWSLLSTLVRIGGAERVRGALEGLLLTWSLQPPPDYDEINNKARRKTTG